MFHLKINLKFSHYHRHSNSFYYRFHRRIQILDSRPLLPFRSRGLSPRGLSLMFEFKIFFRKTELIHLGYEEFFAQDFGWRVTENFNSFTQAVGLLTNLGRTKRCRKYNQRRLEQHLMVEKNDYISLNMNRH